MKICDHVWFAISTVSSLDALMVHCPKCDATGLVIGPSNEEYDAFWKTGNDPQEWRDKSRVSHSGPSLVPSAN
jgi:hypothetical protein